MSTQALRVSALPKGKRRWLVRALKTAITKETEWIETAAVVVGVAFASNRRGEVAEPELLHWLAAHRDELPRLLSEAACLALPQAAKGRAMKALEATNEAEFWQSVQSAAAVADQHWRTEARAS